MRLPADHVRGLILLLGILSIARPTRAVEYDVYLLAGQSNMDGRGPVKDLAGPLAPFAGVQDAAVIWYSNSSLRGAETRSRGWEPLRPGFSVPPTAGPRVATTTAAATRPTSRPARPPRTVPGPAFGPEIGFAKTLTDAGLPAGHRLAILKFAVSGANLRTEWNPQTRGQLYDQFLPFARAGLATLAANGDTCVVRGFLWHQGESDASLPPAAYQALLTDLIAAVRRDFDSPLLPVVLGEPFDNGRRLNVRVAQLATAAAVPNIVVVGSGGLATLDSGTHFDAASQIELGRRFAVAVRTRASVMPSTRPATRPATTPAGDDPP